jgi:hypothetical protein
MRNLEEIQTKLDIEMEIGINQSKLITEVLLHVKRDKLTYMEALMQVCEDHEIEPEDLAKLVSGNLRDRLRAESVQLNCIKDESPVNTLY